MDEHSHTDMCTGVPVPSIARGILYYVCNDGVRRNPWDKNHPLHDVTEDKIRKMNGMFQILNEHYDTIADKSRGKKHKKEKKG